MGVVDSGYVSDHTRWMNEQLEKNPSWVASQKEGRALWWDKQQDTDTTARNNASSWGPASSAGSPTARRISLQLLLLP